MFLPWGSTLELYGDIRGTASRIIVTLAAFAILSALLICLPTHVFAAEQITVLSPGETHFAGQPLLFHIQTSEFTGPVKATAFYRTIGVLSYRKLVMTGETEVDQRALLDGRRIAPPGIEYFYSIEDSKGDIFTFPAENPRQDPYRIEVSLDQSPPKVLSQSPEAELSDRDRRPAITVTYGDVESKVRAESVHILLDGVDVTQLSQISAVQAIYTPREDLPFGEHLVTVDLTDLNGNRMPTKKWTFAVAQSDRFKELTGQLNISGELRSLVDSKHDTSGPEWTLQSNIGLVTKIQTDSAKVSLTANMYYLEEEGPGPAGDNFNLTNYLLEVEKGKTRFALGDLTARGSELLSSSIARRGALVSITGEKTTTEIFALRSNAVTGFDHVIGFNDPDQRLTGGSVEARLTEDGRHTLRVAALTGKNETPDDYNASTLQPGTEGKAYSVGVVSRMAGGKITLTGEVAGSRYDKDLSDGLDSTADTAYVARITGIGGPFTWGGSYRLIGTDFKSIANPTGASDRQEVSLNSGYRAGPSTFALTMGRTRDNVEDDPLRAVINNDTGTFNYNLSKTDWPTIFLNQTLVKQESADEPAGYTPIQNETYTATLGASYGRPTWSMNPTLVLTLFDDQGGATDNDSATRVIMVSGSYRPGPSVSLNPVLNLSNLHNDASGVTIETVQAALSGQFQLKGDRLTLNTTLSHLGNKLDDGSVDTTTFTGTVQLNWKILPTHDETFSLRGQFNNTTNKVTDTEIKDYTIYAVFSFGVPVTLF